MNAVDTPSASALAPLRGVIPDQVRLPASIALGVVLQGLRIRLGRSVVTLTGIVCGIAFLMSIMTGQLVKGGVAREDAVREEVGRIGSFIRADLPSLAGKDVRILGSGALSEVEMRVLESLVRDFGARVHLDAKTAPRPARAVPGVVATAPAAPAAVIAMGDGPVPSFDWRAFFATSGSAMGATTIGGMARPDAIGPEAAARFVTLARRLGPEDLARRAADARKERFRAVWIVAISVLVTVIGIANAMLMSVTERFREIGTMKCLGALSSFVTRMFVMEACILGFFGGLAGVAAGTAFALAMYAFLYGPALVFGALPGGPLALCALGGLAAGVALSVVAAIYPARVAAAMVPAHALRSNV
jgi:hypothetical protein